MTTKSYNNFAIEGIPLTTTDCTEVHWVGEC